MYLSFLLCSIANVLFVIGQRDNCVAVLNQTVVSMA